MKTNRYNSYRGRRGASSVLKGLVIVLLVLLVLGVLSVLLLGNYIEYTDDGARLILPWVQEEQSGEQSRPQTSQDLVISQEPERSPEPDPEQEQRPAVVIPDGAVEVPVEAILSGSARELAGDNAMVVTVKTVEGHLAWQSASPLAEAADDSSGECLNGDPDFSAAVKKLAAEEGAYLVARVNCFCDLWMCVHDRSMILSTPGGKIWYDTKGMPWLSPASEDARNYINSLCLELSELGFDEILLDCAGFPESGRLSAVAVNDNYPASSLGETVAEWLAGLSDLMAGRDTLLSVCTGRKDLGDCPSGRHPEGLALVDRVWVDESVDAALWVAALEEAGMAEAAGRVVQIIAEEQERPETGWAVLSD